ncbi:uncharacterized protein LOC122018678 isoform X1 [Zingiber officinale]|uniref:uncharacterized protein LOC122018678 isoform X1 n=1 Tax=Zingiber officinale TaxID=94328 RepID=UPI001C4D81F4|nr:uncharacterized protein LOC122018678 isoform X1 [Zingiber officinale]
MKILALIGAWFEAFRNKLDLPFRRFEVMSLVFYHLASSSFLLARVFSCSSSPVMIFLVIGAWFEAFRNKLDLPFRRFEVMSLVFYHLASSSFLLARVFSCSSSPVMIFLVIGAWFEAFRNKLDLPFRRFEMASTSSATSLTIDVPEINELPSNSDSKEEDVITAFKLEMKELKEAMMIELESIEIGGKVRISKQLVALGFCLPALVMFGLAIKEAEQEADKLEIGAKMLSTCALVILFW